MILINFLHFSMRDKCRSALLERKVPKLEKFIEGINLVLSTESSQLSHFLLQIPMPWDPQTWLIMDGNKENAIGLLNAALSNTPDEGHQLDGIFLIRPSLSRLGYFVLVITKVLIFYKKNYKLFEKVHCYLQQKVIYLQKILKFFANKVIECSKGICFCVDED